MKEIIPLKGCNVNKERMSEVKPPYNSMGAENTERGVEALIDWFEFSLPLPGSEGLKLVKELLKIPDADWLGMPKGALGYKSLVKCGDISILYDGKPNMGIHVNITGQGCRQYEARFGNRWSELINSIFIMNGGFSRLDAALDDYRGRFTLQDIMNKVLKHEVRTLFGRKKEDGSRRPFRIMIEPDFESAPGANDGLTVYAGSAQSDVMIRFYDKAVQQSVKFPWVRTEIQCRDKRADKLAMEIVGGDIEGKVLGKVAAGVLRTYVNFVEPCADTNMARWAVSSWWSEFLGCVERVRLTIQKGVKTIKETMDWIKRQVSKSLAKADIYLDAKGLDAYDWIGELFSEGRSRFKPADYAQLQAAGVQV